MNGERFLTWIISEENSGMRVQRFCVDQFNGKYSGKQIKHAIERNALVINGHQERHSSRKLIPNDELVFDTSVLALEDISKGLKYDESNVIYEDEYMLIYNKPAGVTSVAGGLLSILQKKQPELLNVHRLDKDTTGAIIFPKNEEVKTIIIDSFREKSMEKIYLAIVDGVIEEDEGVIKEPIGKLYEKDGHTIWGIKSRSRGGNSARTEWKVLRRGEQVTLVQCKLITGRTHQIRIHMSNIGYPIIGDIRYGESFVNSYQPPHHLLHAWKLSFNHPVTGKYYCVKAPPPKEFDEAIDELFSNDSGKSQ